MGCDEPRAAANRAHPRFKLFQPASMINGSETVRVHLLDMSANGARVHHADPPATGATIRLEYAGRMRTARVIWAAQSRFGVAFAVSLSADQVAEALAEQRAIVAAHTARLGAAA